MSQKSEDQGSENPKSEQEEAADNPPSPEQSESGSKISHNITKSSSKSSSQKKKSPKSAVVKEKKNKNNGRTEPVKRLTLMNKIRSDQRKKNIRKPGTPDSSDDDKGSTKKLSFF